MGWNRRPCIARWIHKHWTPRGSLLAQDSGAAGSETYSEDSCSAHLKEGRRKRFCDLSVEVTHVDVCSSPRSADICSFNRHMTEQKGKKTHNFPWPGDGLGGMSRRRRFKNQGTLMKGG